MLAIEFKLLCAAIQPSFMSPEQNYAHSLSSVCLCGQETREKHEKGCISQNKSEISNKTFG